MIITPIITGILVKIVSPEILSRKVEILNILGMLLAIFTLTFLVHSIIQFEKFEKRYERDLLVFKYKYESSDFSENYANNFEYISDHSSSVHVKA